MILCHYFSAFKIFKFQALDLRVRRDDGEPQIVEESAVNRIGYKDPQPVLCHAYQRHLPLKKRHLGMLIHVLKSLTSNCFMVIVLQVCHLPWQ